MKDFQKKLALCNFSTLQTSIIRLMNNKIKSFKFYIQFNTSFLRHKSNRRNKRTNILPELKTLNVLEGSEKFNGVKRL